MDCFWGDAKRDFLLRESGFFVTGSGFYIDPRKKSGWHGRFDGVFVTGHCALMGRGDAFRGLFFGSFGTRRGKRNAHILNKGSQTALIICLPVSLCLNARRGTRRPH